MWPSKDLFKEIKMLQLISKYSEKRYDSKNKCVGGHNYEILIFRSSVTLPFICVSTSRDTEIDCSISDDQSEYHLKFNKEFELHDDIEVLSRLGLTDAAGAEELLPNKLRHFLHNTSKSASSTTGAATSGASVSISESSKTWSKKENDPSQEIVILTQNENPPDDAIELIQMDTPTSQQQQNATHVTTTTSSSTEVPNTIIKSEKNSSVSRSLSFDYKMA